MPRGEQIVRQWRLLQMLQRRGTGLPLRDIAEELEVSERTLQRDLELLSGIGFPLQFEVDEIGKRYWRLPHDFLKSAPLVLSVTEAISLHLAAQFFAPLAGTCFHEGLQSVLQKIRSQLPSGALEYFRHLDETFHVRRVGVTDYTPHVAKIDALTTAARTCRRVEMAYASLWRKDAYTARVDPYGLVYFDGDLFVVGYSHRAKARRVFKLTRVDSVTLTQETFERPPDFDLAAQFRDSFGIMPADGEPVDVEVLFRGPGAGLAEERIWHESQKLEWLPATRTLFEQAGAPPDQLRATFRLAGTVEFKRWIKGFGDLAVVLQPEWLRRELRDELAAAASNYA